MSSLYVAFTRVLSSCLAEFDKAYGGGWQCIVGTDFGSFVTHRYGCFIYFYIGSLTILLFRGSATLEAKASQFPSLETVKA
ncbi:Dynein light chain 2, cytoplasmic [Camellia lanceoleosa]|nr:Dynein light chain 2, cytoplasmic [Camellia lanceoleosa]